MKLYENVIFEKPVFSSKQYAEAHQQQCRISHIFQRRTFLLKEEGMDQAPQILLAITAPASTLIFLSINFKIFFKFLWFPLFHPTRVRMCHVM